MHYVYILRSKKNRQALYIGYTTDVANRLKRHNAGETMYARRFIPWYVETYIAFLDKDLAILFEKYLKSGSGKAFLKQRLSRVVQCAR